MKKCYYITYNDIYSGIYQSQVIDVINHLNKTFNIQIELIAFVPFRLYKNQKKKIKSILPNAKVLPVLGKTNFISATSFWFSFQSIDTSAVSITRGPLAYVLAKKRFKQIVYDARAAVKAEVNEYDVAGGNIKLSNLMIQAEEEAVNSAEFYISVSKKLIEYWKQEYKKAVELSKIALVPCTVNSYSISFNQEQTFSEVVRLVYSGGIGKWQSFEKIVYLTDNLLSKQHNIEILFLTKENGLLKRLIKKYPRRVKRLWVNPDQVNDVLSKCDYGLLIRDDKITNNVASPVKFAEYLNAGLSVLISPKIGDFSEFVQSNDCGIIVKNEIPILEKVDEEKRKYNKKLCNLYFSKNAEIINKEYKKLIRFIQEN